MKKLITRDAGYGLMSTLRDAIPRDLFSSASDAGGRTEALMVAMDEVNSKMGKGAVGFGIVADGRSAGRRHPDGKKVKLGPWHQWYSATLSSE